MDLEEFVSRAIRVPFVPMGRDWNGFDCWGVVCLGYREILGIELPTYTDRYREEDLRGSPHLGELVASCLPEWQEVQIPQPLDVIVFRIYNRPIHVGLVVGAGLVLHSEHKIGTFVERFDSPMWAKRREGIFRHGR